MRRWVSALVVVLAVVAAFAVPTDLEASAVIGSEPIGEWLLEGDVADSAGLNNGVRVGSPTFVVGNAPSSLGLLFNGVDDGVKADAPVGLNILDQSWTVSAWVQVAVKTEPGPSDSVEDQTIAARYACGFNSCDGNPGATWRLRVDTAGKAVFDVRNGTHVIAEGTTYLTGDGQFHCVAGVLDRNVREVNLYVDGEREASVSAEGLTTIDDPGSPFTIGYRFIEGFWVPNDFFKGVIDDVRVHNAALSDSEIKELCTLNQPPVADAGGPYLFPLEAGPFDGTASSDPDGDPLLFSWDFGDTTVVTDAGPAPSHTYEEAGIRDVCLTVTDSAAESDTDCTQTVVYDPSAGFVTGGGWIYSEAGAYRDDPYLEGKATFGFVSKYKKGADVPDGNTQFVFHAGDLDFSSTEYDWLVVAGDHYAMFKGVGTIDGEGEYKFQIWAGDDDADTFRIKIHSDAGVVYDNNTEQEIAGGNIIIHTKKK